MLKVAFVTDSFHMGGAWWRSSGPFCHLRKMMLPDQDIIWDWIAPDQARWSHIASKDILFMVRPYHKLHHNIFTIAQDYRIPIHLDFDDHTLALEYDNVCYDEYMSRESVDLQIRMIALADVVTVSTWELKRQFDQYRPHKDCIVVRNAIDPTLTPWNRKDDGRAPVKRVLWRGSNHHQRDMVEAEEAFIEAANQFPGFEFYFCGYRPWRIIENTKNCFHVSFTDITSYFKCLRGIRPDLVAVPLSDTLFNKCKSNIAAIEGAMAGGMVLGPKWPEWQIEGLAHYEQNFSRRLIELCSLVDSDAELVRHNADVAWLNVLSDFNLDVWNRKRRTIIEALASGVKDELQVLIESDQLECDKVLGPKKSPAHGNLLSAVEVNPAT